MSHASSHKNDTVSFPSLLQHRHRLLCAISIESKRFMSKGTNKPHSPKFFLFDLLLHNQTCVRRGLGYIFVAHLLPPYNTADTTNNQQDNLTPHGMPHAYHDHYYPLYLSIYSIQTMKMNLLFFILFQVPAATCSFETYDNQARGEMVEEVVGHIATFVLLLDHTCRTRATPHLLPVSELLRNSL